MELCYNKHFYATFCLGKSKSNQISPFHACWLECWGRDRKVESSNPGRSGRRIFFSRVNFVCWLLFDVCSIPVLLQWRVNDLGHSAKSAGGRLHLNTHTPLTQQSQNGLTMPLSRHGVGTYQVTSSHATCQATLGHNHTDSGLKGGISVRDLISTFKKKVQAGEWIVKHSPKILAYGEKATTTISRLFNFQFCQ